MLAKIVFLAISLISTVLCGAPHNKGNCSFSGLDNYKWSNGYVFDGISSSVGSFSYTTESPVIVELLEQTSNFLQADIREEFGRIIIEITSKSNFHKIDEFIGTTSSYVTAFSGEFIFNCSLGNSTLHIYGATMDGNEWPPQFKQSNYSYAIPQNVTPFEDITKYGEPILVHDEDFANKDMFFEISPSGVFEIETEIMANKTYRPIITVANVGKLDPNEIYKLKATDAPRYGPKTVSIDLKFSFAGSSGTQLQAQLFALIIFLIFYWF